MTMTEDRPASNWVGTRPVRHAGYDKEVGSLLYTSDAADE